MRIPKRKLFDKSRSHTLRGNTNERMRNSILINTNSINNQNKFANLRLMLEIRFNTMPPENLYDCREGDFVCAKQRWLHRSIAIKKTENEKFNYILFSFHLSIQTKRKFHRNFLVHSFSFVYGQGKMFAAKLGDVCGCLTI